ncbi:DNA-processing protein DprA [Butyrivibrio sp. WCD3002]|uniref:DNA-processing protein DprA n=1 Tax=Butyrivibrio sp. WCD3002 TaxID=1280676 RepID=UPI00040585CC|nr:DNA-processing protein DprA [Butyrivibrio sp. WCD3002]
MGNIKDFESGKPLNNAVFAEEDKYAYMLHNIQGFGNKTLFMLYRELGSCKEIYHASCDVLRKMLTGKQLKAFKAAKGEWDVDGEFEYLYTRGIDFCSYFSEGYPGRLKDIPDPPFALYCAGKMPDEHRPSVSIIGARNSSEYGKYAARLFGEKLALAGIQVISGMARGIDGIAQKAAAYAGGASFGVLGSGVDVCYPEENRALYDELIVSGGIISEYVPGTLPKPQFFPPRNRIISGLSDAVIVIEARQKSGTLITVDMALDQGREVFAVPGRICDNLSSGCNQLIRQGAEIATSPEDVVDFLRRKLMGEVFVGNKNLSSDDKVAETGENIGVSEGAQAESSATVPFITMSSAQQEVYSVMDFYPQTSASIYEKMAEKGINIGISEVMNILVELCITGVAAGNGAGFYKKAQ